MNYSSKEIKAKQKLLRSHSRRMRTKAAVMTFKLVVLTFVFLFIIGTCTAIGAVKGIINTAPEITLDDVTPSQYKTTVYDCNGDKVDTLVASGANRVSVTINEIPDNLKNAFIAIEDERFYQHNGIDAKGIMRAAYVGITNKFRFTEGASTITQQLIKNSVFSVEYEDSLGDRIKRKIQEQYLALKLEETVNNKDAILVNYLNTINLGNNNLGVQSASQNYFNKSVSQLTLSECAVIAAITQNPAKYNPIKYPTNNSIRRQKVLDNMLSQGLISQAEYEEAMADNVYSRILDISNASTTTSSAYSYYTDALIGQIMDDLISQKGYTYTQAYNLVYRGGLSIYSCEDLKLQQYAESIVNDPNTWTGSEEYTFTYRFQIRGADGKLNSYSESTLLKYYQTTLGQSGFKLVFPNKDEANKVIEQYKQAMLDETGGTILKNSETLTFTLEPQASFVLMDHVTGEVKVIIGGRGDKTQSLILNRATDAKRQPGSTFKPLAVYAPALDSAGYTLGSVIDDTPYYYSTGKIITNNDKVYKGYVTVRQAIAESRNVPAVKVLTDIGTTLGYNYALKFGISTMAESDQYNQSLALGTTTVTNIDMTSAYATIANGGVYNAPKLYTKILDHDGNVILDNSQEESEQVIKESTAWLLTSAMRSVITNGTGGLCKIDDVWTAVKTGTTQSNADKWVMGSSTYFTAGCWVGNDDNTSIGSAYDISQQAIWKAVMIKAHEGLKYKEPDMPDSITKAEICNQSGLLPVEGLCDEDPRGSKVITEYFAKGTVPTDDCNVHRLVSFCKASGEVASDSCPSNYIEKKIMIYKNLNGIDLKSFSISDLKYAVTDDMLKNTCKTHSSGGSGNSNNSNRNNRPTTNKND